MERRIQAKRAGLEDRWVRGLEKGGGRGGMLVATSEGQRFCRCCATSFQSECPKKGVDFQVLGSSKSGYYIIMDGRLKVMMLKKES